MNILCIGDIIGRPGRRAVREVLARLRRECGLDFVIGNGENAAGGFGLTAEVVKDLLDLGIDVITTGNHVWDKKQAFPILERHERVLRPLNYPPGVPGRGEGVYPTAGGIPVGVLNLEGRVFMSALDCPFRAADEALRRLKERAAVIVVDFHAEATSEKVALAHYLDGRATVVFGTHTHVQTADERILPGGTAALTDAGMTGGHDSIIGMQAESSLRHFLTQLPMRFEPEQKGLRFNGLMISVDPVSGRALTVTRLNLAINGG